MQITLRRLLAAASAIVVLGCTRNVAPSEQRVPAAKPAAVHGQFHVGDVQIIVDTAAPDSIKSLPLAQQPAFIDNAFRVSPDRRFLYAVAASHHLLTGKPLQPVHLSWIAKEWVVSYDGQTAGTLPELPSFADGFSLLTGWCKSLESQSTPRAADAPPLPDVAQQIQSFAPIQLIDAVRKVEPLWNTSRRDDAVVVASKALARLQFQSFDQFEFGDAFSGTTLAILAMAGGNNELLAERTLTAASFGYETDALMLAQALPPTHAVRLFLNSDHAGLERVARDSHADTMTRFLYLLQLSRNKGAEPAFEWLARNSESAPEVLFRSLVGRAEFQTILDMASLEQMVAIETLQEMGTSRRAQRVATLSPNVAVHEAVMQIAEPMSERLKFSPETRVAMFEQLVAKNTKQLSGPIVSTAFLRSYFDGAFYNGVKNEASVYLDGLSSLPATREFIDQFGRPTNSQGSEVKWWLTTRLLQDEGDDTATTVVHEVSERTELAPRMLKEVFDQSIQRMQWNEPATRSVSRTLLGRMDSRPSNLIQAGRLFWAHVNDRLRYERHFARAIELAPNFSPADYAWFHRVNGDAKALQKMVERKTCVECRGVALKEMGNLENADAAYVRARFRDLTRDDPSLLYTHVSYLQKKKEWAAVRDVASRWLDANPDAQGLTRAYAATQVAAAHRELGQLDKASAALAPYLGSWKEDVLEEASIILVRKNRLDDAMKMAMAERERYPQSVASHAAVARVLWAKKEYVEAAKVVKESASRFPGTVWNEFLPPAFGDVFTDADRDARAAFLAVMDEGVHYFKLHALARSLTDAGKPEAEFMLLSMVVDRPEYAFERDAGMAMRIRLDAHRVLAEFRGNEAAAEWFLTHVPESNLDYLALSLYSEREWDLLWALADRAPDQKSAKTDFLLVASLINQKAQQSERWNQLVERWRHKPSDTFFSATVRYLLDLDSADPLLVWYGKPGYYPDSFAFVFGMKQASEGRYVDAANWFQAAAECGNMSNPFRTWAMYVLRFWQRQEKPFTEIASERLL